MAVRTPSPLRIDSLLLRFRRIREQQQIRVAESEGEEDVALTTDQGDFNAHLAGVSALSTKYVADSSTKIRQKGEIKSGWDVDNSQN